MQKVACCLFHSLGCWWTVLYKIKQNETVTTIPTVGFNVETVQPTKNVCFTVWDVGGQQVLRPLWRHYFQGCDGLVYIVDSSDRTGMDTQQK